jgi:hypothetical protein
MSYNGVTGSYYARTGDCVKAAVGDTWKPPGRYCLSGDLTSYGANNYDGLMVQDWGVPVKKATDGLSKTLMLGERWYEQRAWLIGSFSKSPFDPGNARNPVTPTGPQPVTAWFASRNLSDRAPINMGLTKSCYVGHDFTKDRPTGLPTSCAQSGVGLPVNDLPFGSFHPGGANFANGDGSVRFLNDSIDMATYLAIGSRNGGEVVSE